MQMKLLILPLILASTAAYAGDECSHLREGSPSWVKCVKAYHMDGPYTQKKIEEYNKEQVDAATEWEGRMEKCRQSVGDYDWCKKATSKEQQRLCDTEGQPTPMGGCEFTKPYGK